MRLVKRIFIYSHSSCNSDVTTVSDRSAINAVAVMFDSLFMFVTLFHTPSQVSDYLNFPEDLAVSVVRFVSYDFLR